MNLSSYLSLSKLDMYPFDLCHSVVPCFHIPTSEHCVLRAFLLENVLRAAVVCYFWHPSFQEWSEHGVFCTFDLKMCFARQRLVFSFFHLAFSESLSFSVVFFCFLLLIFSYYRKFDFNLPSIMWILFAIPSCAWYKYLDVNVQHLKDINQHSTSHNEPCV